MVHNTREEALAEVKLRLDELRLAGFDVGYNPESDDWKSHWHPDTVAFFKKEDELYRWLYYFTQSSVEGPRGWCAGDSLISGTLDEVMELLEAWLKTGEWPGRGGID